MSNILIFPINAAKFIILNEDFANVGTLTFPTSMMTVNNSYVFSVIITIGTRSSRAELMIDLVEGVLPSIVIGSVDRKVMLLPQN